MFKIKNLVIVSTILAASVSASAVLAATSYKGEDYKNEAPPCPVYQFMAGPYLGLSIGPKITYGDDASYVGGEATLSGGYAAMLTPDWYLAGELSVADSVNFRNQRALDVHHVGDVDSSRTSWNYGLDILPGYMINSHVLAYVRAGVVETRFRDEGVNKAGWRLGLGTQTNVYQNWDVRGEYVYSSYNNVGNVGHVSGHNVNVGVVYKFL